MRFSEDELHELERVGADSFAELHASLARHGIDAHYEANGVLWIATEPYQVAEIDEEVELIRRFGGDAVALDGEPCAARSPRRARSAACGIATEEACSTPSHSPTGCAARYSSSACGSARARRSRACARSPGASSSMPGRSRRAQRVVLATSAYPPLVRSVRPPCCRSTTTC